MAGCGQKAAVPRTGRVSRQILPNCCANDTIVARRQPCGRPAAGARHEVAISRHGMPELRLDLWPFRKRRAQGKPGADCTRGLVCKSAHCGRTRAYRFSRNSPAFPAQWFYGVLRALPGERIRLVTVACGKRSRKLGTSNGCQDHTTWPYAPAFRPALQHHPFGNDAAAPDAEASITSPALRIVTIAKRPSCGPGCRD
jgi:hypothetical protein